MVAKICDLEKQVLINKYLNLGFTLDLAEKEVEKHIQLIVSSEKVRI